MKWTRLMNMYRGGKHVDWSYLYIRADPATAVEYVRTEFDVDPLATGERWYHWDFTIRQYDSLGAAVTVNTAPGESFDGHLTREDVLVVLPPELADDYKRFCVLLNDSNTRRHRRPGERHRDGVRP